MTRKSVLLAVLLLLVAAGVIVAALTAPWFFSLVYWQEGGVGTSRSEVVRNLVLAGIALGALIVGSTRAWSAHRQANVAEQGNFTERFSTAVEHLGSEQLPVRLGGIYALWRLAEDSSLRDLKSVIDILCAFVRDPPHPDPLRETPDPDGSVADAVAELLAETPPGPDVQAILDLIGDRDAPYRERLPDSHRLDLTGANLRVANLTSADLRAARLTRAILTDADLSDANLRGADLTDANLMCAALAGANLRGADLRGANLADANLRSAILEDANLTNVDFTGADLTGAILVYADLTNANLLRANLTLADLTIADLADADLTDANLLVTNGTQEQLDSACIREGGKPPTLPQGLNPPQKVCVP